MRKQVTQRQRKAIRLQNEWREWAVHEGQAFIEKARIAWKMRELCLYQELGFRSFDQWACSPEQNETVTGANLGAQVMEVFVMFFRIRRPALYGIGFKKLMLITPLAARMMRHHVERCETEWAEEPAAFVREQWIICQMNVEYLIDSAKTLSWSSLYDMCKDARDGWDTLYSKRVPMSYLRSVVSVTELLALLGLSDLDDDANVKVSIRGKSVKRKWEAA